MPDVNRIRLSSSYPLVRDISQLQSAARQAGTITATVGHRTYNIHHIHSSDWFTVERIRGGGIGSLLRRGDSVRARHLEWQLNHLHNHATVNTPVPHNPPSSTGEDNLSHKQLNAAIKNCSFTLSPNMFNCPENLLTCPITLSTPTLAVFMRNAADSNVCTIYDMCALQHLINIQADHPLSREPITASMIISKDKCCFDTTKNNFISIHPQTGT
ncbi:T3SS effector NleG family protein [Shigella flexneri]